MEILERFKQGDIEIKLKSRDEERVTYLVKPDCTLKRLFSTNFDEREEREKTNPLRVSKSVLDDSKTIEDFCVNLVKSLFKDNICVTKLSLNSKADGKDDYFRRYDIRKETVIENIEKIDSRYTKGFKEGLYFLSLEQAYDTRVPLFVNNTGIFFINKNGVISDHRKLEQGRIADNIMASDYDINDIANNFVFKSRGGHPFKVLLCDSETGQVISRYHIKSTLNFRGFTLNESVTKARG